MSDFGDRFMKAHTWTNGKTGHSKLVYAFGAFRVEKRTDRLRFLFLDGSGGIHEVPRALGVEFMRLLELARLTGREGSSK